MLRMFVLPTWEEIIDLSRLSVYSMSEIKRLVNVLKCFLFFSNMHK